MCKVSIIVPCFKQAEFLGEALDSVLSQTFPDWECVVVNDGSPDDTEVIAKRYAEKDPRFKYVTQENKGLSAARNAGIQVSHGEFVLPLDADDIIEPSYIEKAVGRFTSHPETKLVYCRADKFGETNCAWDLPEYDYDRLIWENCIFCSALYRRSDYDQTSGYNANMTHGYEDWDFWLSLLKRGDVVFRIDEILFHYRVKEVSMITQLTKGKRTEEESLVQVCRNHPEIYQPYMERIIVCQRELTALSASKEDAEAARSSHAYRLGKFLLKPFSWFRKK